MSGEKRTPAAVLREVRSEVETKLNEATARWADAEGERMAYFVGGEIVGLLGARIAIDRALELADAGGGGE